VALAHNNFDRVADVCRNFFYDKKYGAEGCRLFNACFRGVVNPDENYCSPIVGKLIRRLFFKVFVDGNDSIKVHLAAIMAHLHYCAGHISQAINCYLKAWSLKPDDALLNLMLGICFAQRAFHKKEVPSRNFGPVILNLNRPWYTWENIEI
jgi:hypothetical protein